MTNSTNTFAGINVDTWSDSPRASSAAVALAVIVTTIASIFALYYWLDFEPTMILEAEVPGHDGLPEGGLLSEVLTDLSGVFEAFEGKPSSLPGSWTSFRGADSDNISKATQPLADSWGEDGPEILWSVEIGDGYAAPVVLNGAVYLMDYDLEERRDTLRCFSLDDGKEIWRRSYDLNIKRNHGMSRTIPAVTEKYIVTIGPKCHVVCLDTATGDFRWGIDLQREYGTEEPLWYAAQCALIDNGEVILAPSGTDTLMMGVDLETGTVNWKTPNPHGWNMAHSSIMPMTVAGKRMYVYSALGGISGVSAEGDDVGELLWEIPWIAKVVSPSPVKADENLIFITAGYGTGSRMLRIEEKNGAYSVEVISETAPGEGLSCEQQTPIVRDGLLYGIMPKDAGSLKLQFVCYRPDGTLAWSSGADNRFGFGPFFLADDKFYILDDDGVLTMLDASKPKYVQLAQAQLLHGHDPWGPISLAGSRMLLRDMDNLICIDVGET